MVKLDIILCINALQELTLLEARHIAQFVLQANIALISIKQQRLHVQMDKSPLEVQHNACHALRIMNVLVEFHRFLVLFTFTLLKVVEHALNVQMEKSVIIQKLTILHHVQLVTISKL